MLSRTSTAIRSNLLARSRLYLAALVTGGVALGGGLTAAAAHADAGSVPQGKPHVEHHRTQPRHHRQHKPSSTPAQAAPVPSASPHPKPVRPAPTPSAAPTPPSARSHAS